MQIHSAKFMLLTFTLAATGYVVVMTPSTPVVYPAGPTLAQAHAVVMPSRIENVSLDYAAAHQALSTKSDALLVETF